MQGPVATVMLIPPASPPGELVNLAQVDDEIEIAISHLDAVANVMVRRPDLESPAITMSSIIDARITALKRRRQEVMDGNL